MTRYSASFSCNVNNRTGTNPRQKNFNFNIDARDSNEAMLFAKRQFDFQFSERGENRVVFTSVIVNTS